MSFNGNTNTFDTISDLKSQMGNSNSRVNVLGYYSPGDGGGGQFYWDSVSTEADNAGTIFQVTGVATGRWKRSVTGNELNVLWFGAKNDYTSSITTDNITAINAAISAAVVLRTAGFDSQTQPSIVSIYFPYGKGFRITNTINVPNNISIVMDGQVVFDNSANDRPAIVIGDTTLTQRKRHVIDVTNKNATIWPAEDGNGDFDISSIGIKFVNHYYCDINVKRAANFTVGMQCVGSPLGFVYNEVQLGMLISNKLALDLTGADGGWCNENNFFGGRFATITNVNNNGKNRYGVRISTLDNPVTVDSYIDQNNNNFYKPAFELSGSIANPGIALPILIKYGSMNAFYNCRAEGNYVASTVLMRTMNGSAQNVVEVGYGLDGTIDDIGTSPSSTFLRRSRILMEQNYSSVFDSGDILRSVCPYDATNTYAANELFFLSSSDANTYTTLTSITTNTDSLQLASSRGVGVRIDTTSNKRFIVKRSAIVGSGGRVGIRCFDSAGAILYDAVNPYVKGYAFAVPTAASTFGGHYGSGTDNTTPFYFAVGTTVASIDVFVKGGTNPAKIRQFQIQAIDSLAGVISLKKKSGLFAIQPPATGTWTLGDVINNNNPASNNIVLWQCTVAGTPGTWAAQNNINSGINSLNGLTTPTQTFATGTSGTDFNIASTSTTHTLNWPDASATARGPVNTTTQTFAGAKTLTGLTTLNAGTGVGTVHNRVGTNAATRWEFINAGASSDRMQLRSFTTSNVEAIRFDPNGTNFISTTSGLGIGTNSPSNVLHVKKIDGRAYFDSNGGFFTIDLVDNNARRAYLGIPGGGTPFTIGVATGVAGSEVEVPVINITNTGNVGIGTNSSGNKLEVGGNVYSNGGSFLSNNAEGLRVINSGGYLGFFNSGNTTRTGYIQWHTSSGGIINMEQNLPISLRTNNIERIYLGADGNIGIGTNTPGAKLEVAGQVKITGGTPGVNKVLVSDAAGLASWGNVTPAPADIQGNGNLSAIPSTWVTVILNHTSNLGFTSLANYPGGYTGRVVTIINATNFTFQISTQVYPAKSVLYITWDTPTTPVFTQV